MEAKNFQVTIEVNASPAAAMEKIAQVNQWWAKKLKGSAEKSGDKFRVDFGETFVDFQVTELIPGKKVAWTVTGCNLHWIKNKKEWNGTRVVFEMAGKDNSCRIHFTHIGLVPACECYEDCKAGWTEHITDSLANFINKGKGMPQ